ncbi:MAG: hypothetical protein ACLFVU_14050, partial [Phycisphaerae bacterium]
MTTTNHSDLIAECERLRADRLRREAAEQAREIRQQRARKWKEFCPSAFRQTDPDRLAEVSGGASRKVLAWTPGAKGLLLRGPSAVGKTRTAWMLLGQLHLEGQTVVGMSAFGFSVEASRRAMDGTFG